MTDNENFDRELFNIFRLFFDGEPTSFEAANTSRGNEDFREAVTVNCGSGLKYMIKLDDNDFTFPEKIDMWRKTAEEYRRLGYYCPRILPDREGNYPMVSYKGRRCVAYMDYPSGYRLFDTFCPSGNTDEILVYRLHELNSEHNAAYQKQKGEHICEACVYNR